MGLQADKTFLGRYELRKKIAEGGIAELYLAEVTGVGGFQKQVVVKRILPQLADSKDLFRIFLDEGRIAATLHHPNLVQIYDSCEENGEYFMAMEYLDGTDLRTLENVLADNGLSLPWEHALHIASSVAAGLHYAHEKRDAEGLELGIVHRDVAPHNIFLTREGGIKLVDFGIAKAEGHMTKTAMDSLRGNLAYMSPEQCQRKDVDRSSDIYSLGIILYELTTGRRLYKSITEHQLSKEIVDGEILPPSRFMDYPEALESIILRCLQKNPESRFETAREVQVALEDFARESRILGSALGFASFLEPLLEEATAAAEKHWKQRQSKRAETSGVVQAVLAVGSGAPQVCNAAGEHFASDQYSDTDSSTVRMPSARFPEHLKSIPNIPAQLYSSSLGLGFPHLGCHTAGQRTPDLGESMTARVPPDTLARIREEERQLVEEQEARAAKGGEAVPHLAPKGGAMRLAAGSARVSAHVIARGSVPVSRPVLIEAMRDDYDETNELNDENLNQGIDELFADSVDIPIDEVVLDEFLLDEPDAAVPALTAGKPANDEAAETSQRADEAQAVANAVVKPLRQAELFTEFVRESAHRQKRKLRNLLIGSLLALSTVASLYAWSSSKNTAGAHSGEGPATPQHSATNAAR